MDSLTASTKIEGLESLLPLLEEGRHEEALPLIEGRLAKQPDVPLWKYLKALVLAIQGRGTESANLMNEVCDLPDFSEGFGLPPDVHTLAKTSALNHLFFETSVEPTSLQPWINLEEAARVLNSDGFLTKAIMGRWKALPEDEALPRKFEAHFKDKSLDDKIRILENLLEDNPDSCLPRASLGHYMQEKGKTALAIRHLKSALDSNEKAWQPHLYLGRVFFAQGRFEDAENRFSEALNLLEGGNAELLAAVASCQKATYRYDEAMETFFQALEEHPAEFTSWDELEELSNAMGCGERLLATVQKVAAEDPTNLALASKVITLALNSNDPLEAKARIQATGVLSNPGKNPEMTLLAARMFELLAHPEKSAQLLELSLKTHPEDIVLRTAYGMALLSAGRSKEGEEVLKETAKHHPHERDVQLAWGRGLMEIGQAEGAQRSFTAASRLSPGDPEPLAEQGRALVSMGKYDEALAVLKESAKIADQQHPMTMLGLGMVYEKKKLNDISKDFFRQALEANADSNTAAQGWLRLHEGSSRELVDEGKSLIEGRSTDFEKCQLYINLLLSGLHEGLAEFARLFHQDLFESVKSSMKVSHYAIFMEKGLAKQLPLMARDLEQRQKLEEAREAWRFAVTSNLADLTQKATAELLRLDKVVAEVKQAAKESPQPTTPEPAAAPQAVTSLLESSGPVFPFEEPTPQAELVQPAEGATTDDPLLSLLSTTIPEGETAPSEQPVPLFETPTSVDAAPTTVTEEAPLFATSDVSTLTAEVTEGAAAPEVSAPPNAVAATTPQPSPAEESEPAQATASASVDATVVTPPSTDTSATVPVATAPTPDLPESVATPATPAQPESVATPATPDQSESVATPTTPAQPESVATPAAPDQSESVATSAAPDHSESVTTTDSPEPTEPGASPTPATGSNEAVETVPQPAQETEPVPVAGPTEPSLPPEPERKDLLPIPMAVDFEPQTRRQLHFHEALVQNRGGVLSPESIAHLMVCSGLGHEPPDPSTDQEDSTKQLQTALLQSARTLAEQNQYRSAARVLKTALLYAPDAEDVRAELVQVQTRWAHWLAESKEFAHAVGLIRDALHRQPDAAGLDEQLAQTYQTWMTWSDENGDTAARDLLAVYLQQEQASIESFRASWKTRAAQIVAAQPSQGPPRVQPTMPQQEVAPEPSQAEAQSAATVVSEPAQPEQPTAPVPPEQTTAPTAPEPTAAPTASEPVQPEAQPATTTEPEPAQTQAPAVQTEPVATNTGAAAADPVSVESQPTPEPPQSEAQPVAQEQSAPESTGAPEAAASVEPTTQAESAEVTTAEPPSTTPTATASTPAASFSSSSDALAALDAAPEDESVSNSVFEFHKDSMRTLTTALRERVSSNDEPIWLLLLARAFRKSGSETMAVIQYQKYIKAAPSPEAYEELATTYEEIGKEDFAKMTRRKAERAFSD